MGDFWSNNGFTPSNGWTVSGNTATYNGGASKSPSTNGGYAVPSSSGTPYGPTNPNKPPSSSPPTTSYRSGSSSPSSSYPTNVVNTPKGYAYTDQYGFSHVVGDLATALQFGRDGSIQGYNGDFAGGYAIGASGSRLAVPTAGAIPYGNDVRDNRQTNWASSSSLSPLDQSLLSSSIGKALNKDKTLSQQAFQIADPNTTKNFAKAYVLEASKNDKEGGKDVAYQNTGYQPMTGQMFNVGQTYNAPRYLDPSNGQGQQQSLEPWQQTLQAIQGGNKDLFNQQLARAQQKWQEYNAAGDTEKADAAHQWANQLRDAAGFAGQYNPTNGSMYLQPQNQDYTMQPMKPQEDPYLTEYKKREQALNDLMKKAYDPKSELYAGLSEKAQAAAQKQYETQIAQFQNILDQLNNSKSDALRKIDSNVEDARSSLDDQEFQNWLQARQQLADRGMANSGYMGDAATRLMLAKQKDLAGVFRSATDNKASIENNYGSQINDINRQKALVNKDDMYNNIFQNLFSTAQKSVLDGVKMSGDQLKTFNDFMGNVMKNNTDLYKWDNPSGNEQLKAKTDLALKGMDINWKQFEFGNISATDQAKIQKDYDLNNADNQTKMWIAQLNNSTKQAIAGAQIQAANARAAAAQSAASAREIMKRQWAIMDKTQSGALYAQIADNSLDGEHALKLLYENQSNIIATPGIGIKGWEDLLKFNAAQIEAEKQTKIPMTGGNFRRSIDSLMAATAGARDEEDSKAREGSGVGGFDMSALFGPSDLANYDGFSN